MAARMLWNYVKFRAKTLLRNYNVIERGEKVLDVEKRQVSPRHPGTQVKFGVLIKGDEKIQAEMARKPTELLDRLKTVKVDSEDYQVEPESSRSMPDSREPYISPKYGYEESVTVPEGRCSLKDALNFISNHQNEPELHSMESISKEYKLDNNDVYNVLKHFRVFQVYIARDQKTALAKSELSIMGAGKVTYAKYKSKFAGLDLNQPENLELTKKKE